MSQCGIHAKRKFGFKYISHTINAINTAVIRNIMLLFDILFTSEIIRHTVDVDATYQWYVIMKPNLLD